MATEVGTAYVSVLAKTTEAEKGIKASLDKSVKEADKAGKTMGDKLSAGLVKNMDKTGAKTGTAFNKGFAPQVASGGKNAMAGLGQMMMGGAEGIGGNVGGGIMGSLVGALNKGASKAISALEGMGVKGGSAMQGKLVAAGTVAAGGIALITAAAVTAGKALYSIGEDWDGIADGIMFKTGKVGKELDKITDSIKKVGLESFSPLGDIGNVSTGLVKGLNLSGEALEKMTKQITDYNSMAAENNMDPINLNEFMKAMKRFKMEGDVDGMMSTLEGLFDVSQDTTIPLNTLITTMKNIGTQAGEFKIPAQQVVQILAEMDNAGMDAQSAMIGFRFAMKNLAGEIDPAGAFREKINEIEQLANSTDEAAQAKGRETAQALFGNKAWEVYYSLIKDGKIDVDNLNTVIDTTGDTISDTRDKTADFAQEWTRFKNFLSIELEPVATRVFGGINDWLTQMANGARDLIGWFKDPSWDKIANIAKGLGGLLNPMAAIGGAIGGALGRDMNNSGQPSGGGGANRSAAGLQPVAADLQEKIAQAFPAVKDIGGFRANDKYPDHPSGKAIDVMIPPELVGTPMGKLLGDSINKYALQNGAAYTMWGQQQYMSDGTVKGMPDRGSPTQNHMDHVHILTRDTGGVLPPGLSVIRNGTGKNEMILNPEQQERLAAAGVDVDALMAGEPIGGEAPLMSGLDFAAFAFLAPWREGTGFPANAATAPFNPGPMRVLNRDTGGKLPPGWSIIKNGTGQDELILNPEQQKSLAERGRMPYEDEPGWDWRTQGNKRGKQPLEDEPGWDWRTMGNRQAGPGVANQPLEDEPGWDWRTMGNRRAGPGVAEQPLEDEPGWDSATMGNKSGAIHGASNGAAPGPTASNRTEGFVPVAASNGGVAGTSMFSAFLNMGAEATNGAIDAAAQAAQLAVSAGAAAGTMGAGAAAGPAASMGIQAGSAMAKRGVSYGFQMAGIVGDALIEQLFPFGAPRWIGYDYTDFAPGGGGQPIGITTGEQATNEVLGLAGAEQPDPGLASTDAIDVNSLQPQASPPLVNIGSINGVNPDDVGKIITDRQRLAQMQYGGRP